jgi:hypothetical protein
VCVYICLCVFVCVCVCVCVCHLVGQLLRVVLRCAGLGAEEDTHG